MYMQALSSLGWQKGSSSTEVGALVVLRGHTTSTGTSRFRRNGRLS